MTSIEKPQEHAPSIAVAPAKLPHLPVLDGIRGIAILMILTHHLFSIDFFPLPVRAFISSLFIGVDVFLVLSGFLITRILLAAREDQRYFRNFYARRALRIFPLYYAYLLAIFLISIAGGIHDFPLFHYVGSRANILWAAFYLTNVLVTLRGHWISPFYDPLWSLAVEEHFYLVWPLMVRWLAPRRLAALCVAIVLGTALLRLSLAWQINTRILYVLTPFRLDALAAGAGLAAFLHIGVSVPVIRKWGAILFAATTMGMAILAAIGPGLENHEPAVAVWIYPITAVFFSSGLALLVTRPTGTASALVGNPLFRFFGRYSYCLYLVHLPVAVALEPLFQPEDYPAFPHAVYLVRAFAALVVSIGIALISWNLLEKRCLRLKAAFA